VKHDYVGNAPFFSVLSEEERERVSQRMHLEHRRSADVLFQPGDDSTALYLIKSGWVRLTTDGGAALASQGPGSLVGETDLFLDKPRSHGATVATDAELWVLSREDLVDLMAETPQIGLELALAFGSRLPLFDQYLCDFRLKPLPFLAGLEDDALAAIARRLVPVEMEEGEFIVEAGQPPEALFIVESGQVRLPSSEEGGDFSQLGTGETFGELALLTGKPHSRAAQAATDVVLWALPVAEFESLAEECPEIRLALSNSFREPLAPEDLNLAMERLSAMRLFSGLSEEVLWAVAQRLLLRHVPAGEQIYAEGAPGDALYLIDTGQVEIGPDGRREGPGEFFGEMALLTGKPRSTTVTAADHTNLWVLYRSDFDDLVNRYPAISLGLSKELSERLAEMDRRFTESHLRGLKLLDGMSSVQLEDISHRLKPVRFRQHEVIIQEGEPGGEMFFIESGQVQVLRGFGANTLVLAEMGAGDLFGEMALLTGKPRTATVMALSDVNLWAMSQADFDEVVNTYPHLALALGRLLSERLSDTDAHIFQQPPAPAPVASPVQQTAVRRPPAAVPVAATAAVAATQVLSQPAPQVAPQPRPAPRPKPKPAPRRVKAKPALRPAKAGPARSITAEVTKSFDGVVDWFGTLSRGAKVRLVLVSVLIAWLVLIVAPALVISTLAAENVTNLQGAIAFVQTVTPMPSDTPLPTDTPIPPTLTPIPPTQTPVPPTETPLPTETSIPPTAPPLPTETPVPPTATPVPPTPTLVPPTVTPVPTIPPRKPSTASAASGPPPQPKPPRELDPRLAALNVGIHEPNVQPGQGYWRLVRAIWQNKEESGNDHTIYLEVLDEHGSRIVGQPIEIRWQDGSLVVVTEDKPRPEYSANFPMFGTLGSYSVSVPGLPSDTVVGLGMGTPERPDFTIHTNFLLTFQRVKR
jgi:CRP-like cAMP-binding protein